MLRKPNSTALFQLCFILSSQSIDTVQQQRSIASENAAGNFQQILFPIFYRFLFFASILTFLLLVIAYYSSPLSSQYFIFVVPNLVFKLCKCDIFRNEESLGC